MRLSSIAQAQADLGGLDESFARGDYSGLLGWLRTKVHSQGQRYRPAELIEQNHRLKTRPPSLDRWAAAEVR